VALPVMDAGLVALVRDNVHLAILGLARVAPCFAWLPYLESGAVSSRVTKTAIAFLVVLGLWQEEAVAPATTELVDFLVLVAREALVGTAIGLGIALPFHIFHAIGSVIDNQRGASISSSIDPLNGIDSSETSKLLQMFCTVVFLQTGGLQEILAIVRKSYQVVPTGTWLIPDLDAVTGYIATLLEAAIVIAAPVLLVLFLVEVLLGVLSRFAQQMNAFAVSLSVKSFVAFIALALYLGSLLTEHFPTRWEANDPLRLLGRMATSS
jgi:type III secretion protein SpaR/YscT/HrcT